MLQSQASTQHWVTQSSDLRMAKTWLALENVCNHGATNCWAKDNIHIGTIDRQGKHSVYSSRQLSYWNETIFMRLDAKCNNLIRNTDNLKSFEGLHFTRDGWSAKQPWCGKKTKSENASSLSALCWGRCWCLKTVSSDVTLVLNFERVIHQN